MSRKDYIALAAMMAARKPNPGYAAVFINWRNICNDLADICAADNPNFDRGRFIAACEG